MLKVMNIHLNHGRFNETFVHMQKVPEVREYDQEMPQSHNADQHTTSLGRAPNTNSHVTARRQLMESRQSPLHQRNDCKTIYVQRLMINDLWVFLFQKIGAERVN